MPSISTELYEFIIKIVDERVKEIKVTREEFNKLVEEVRQLVKSIDRLAEAQKRTEERVDRLSKALEELAEAQKRTEERVDRLSKALEELAEAQKRTEERVDKLAKVVDSLVLAVGELSDSVKMLKVEVGRLSETVGFGLEDIARVVLPGWLQRHTGIYVEELRREFFTVNGEEIEVDLFGEGLKDKKKVFIIGEVKSRIYRHDVEQFYRKYSKLKKVLPRDKLIGVLFGYLIHPSARKQAQKHGFYTIASYER